MGTKVKETCTVLSQECIGKDIYSMWLQTKTIAENAKPGQFVSVYTQDGSKLLPRPISICEINRGEKTMRFVYRVVGEGTKEFSKLSSGDKIEVLGPLGNGFPIPEKKNIPDLLGRSFFGTVGLLFNFYAIGQLNLSDANMLNKLSPFFAILFSVFLLGEKPNLMQIGGVCVAFLGSVCIIKPSFQNPAMLPALAGMLGGMGAGIAYTFVRRLGMKGENSKRIIFWFSAFSCLFQSIRSIFRVLYLPLGSRIFSPLSSRTYSFFDFAAHAPFSSRGRIVKRIWA